MKIVITADGRNLAATTGGQPLTSGSVGIEAAFILSADYDDLAVTAVFSAGETRVDVLLTTPCCIVPWEVLQEPKATLFVGVVGKNGSGEIVIPTVWGRVGMIECGTVANGLDPEDPTPDIAAQILQQARAALEEAEETKEAAAQSAQDAADDAERAEAAKQAVEDLGVTAHEDPDGPSVEKSVDPETGAVTLDFGFKPAGVTEVNGQAGAVSLDLDDIPDGAQYVRPTPAQVQQIGANKDDIADIEDLIPNQATPQNQLADKDFVNSSINSSAAFFRGAFPTRAALFAVVWQTSDPTGANYVSNNDYAYVTDDETHNDEAWRYLYVLQPGGTDNGWQPQFRVNESPLTAAQLAALNSGATAETIASIADKYVLPAGGMPSADMSDAVRASLQKADTALQAVPDTYRTAAAQDEIDQAQDTEIRDLKSALGPQYLNIIDVTHYISTNAAVIYNNDGTFTIGTTDYGTTTFNNGQAIYVKRGKYMLSGVSNGKMFVAPSNNVGAAIHYNDSISQKEIEITEQQEGYLYVGFYISPKPSESFVITPFLNKIAAYEINKVGIDVNNNKTELLATIGDKADEIMPVYLYNGYKQKSGNGYYNADGTVTENTSWQYCSDYIPIMPNSFYSAWRIDTYITGANAYILWYTINKELISRSNNAGTFTSPANAYYCKISINDSGSQPMFISGTTNPGFYRPYGIKFANDTDSVAERNIKNVSSSNLPILNSSYNYEDISVTEEDGYINYAGYLSTGNTWKHIEVNVEGGNTYYFEGSSAAGCYAMLIFDDYQLIQAIPASLGSGSYSQNVKMPGNAKRVIINKSSTGIVLKKAVSISMASTNASNILYGKKLYCGGDSITEAVNVGSFPDNVKKSYAGFVVERNGMTYTQDGIGGSTMGNVTIDGYNLNSYCVSRYTSISSDADYITLWFGWNDSAYGWKSVRDAYCYTTYSKYYSQLADAEKAEVDAYRTWREWLTDYVGTIDSSDDKTWYGAWNKVLTWILNNRSTARVGIVIAYGMYTELETAMIAICEKYGINYVKAYDPHEFFSVGHSHGIGENQAVKRKQLYTLDNTHPNELGYEMMSASYEQFLRRL